VALFTTILGSALLGALANAAVAALASYAISSIARSFQKKPKAQTQSLDFEQIIQRRLSLGQPLEVLVGRRIVAGIGLFDDAYSTKNEQGVSISVLSAKPCTTFHTLYLDGEPMTLSGDPTTGEVNVTSHFLGKNDATRVKVRVFLGDNNSGLGAYLATKFPSKYTATDNHGDYCVIVMDCRNTNDDLGGEEDPEEQQGKNFIPFQGYPEYRAELSGVKVCDPRLSGADYADESTYIYSSNAALIDAQYDYGWYSGIGAGRGLIVGNGYPVAIMDLDQIISNANYCDTESFGANGVLRSGQQGDQEEVWKCFNADRVEHSASVYSVPEGNRVLSETIDLSQYISSFVSNYDADGFSTEVYNEIRTVYSEPEEFYGEKDLPIYSKPEWVAADNHIPRQLSLPLLFVTDKVQAGKLEKQEINISRSASTCTIADLPYGFIRIKVGDLIGLTGTDIDAVNDETWIVKSRGETSRGDVALSLRKYATNVAFDFDEETETPNPNINVRPPRPWAEWWQPTNYVPPSVINNIAGIRDGTFQVADLAIVDGGFLSTRLETIDNNVGNVSTSSGSGGTLNVSGSASYVTGDEEVTGGSQTVVTNSVTMTITGGTGPFTGVWNLISGQSVPPNALTTEGAIVSGDSFTFSRTIAQDDIFEGTYRLTVEDSTGATANYDVTATVFDSGIFGG